VARLQSVLDEPRAPNLALRAARNDGGGEQAGAERRAGYRLGAELIRAGGLVRRGLV
jgi:hypothetical protein